MLHSYPGPFKSMQAMGAKGNFKLSRNPVGLIYYY
jgi:hypothetical protein